MKYLEYELFNILMNMKSNFYSKVSKTHIKQFIEIINDYNFGTSYRLSMYQLASAVITLSEQNGIKNFIDKYWKTNGRNLADYLCSMY